MSAQRVLVSGFRDCDVRGALGTDIDETLAYRIGRAIATMKGPGKAVVGGDFRLSTPDLMRQLIRGLNDSGMDVVDLGQLTTPGYYFARRHLGLTTGIMVSASHSPADWNGFKIALDYYPVTPEQVNAVRDLAVSGDFTEGSGTVESFDPRPVYRDFLIERFAGLGDKLPLVIFDCGNGATGWVLREVIEGLGIQSDILFEAPDGRYPNRSPDIARPGDLAILQQTVIERGAGMGFGFDGDGDRVGVIDEKGQRVTSDSLIAWIGQQLVGQAGGGHVIYDLKLSRLVIESVLAAGGQPAAQKSGHTFIKTSMLEKDAIFGGEFSGHLFYRELGGGDDGLFSALLVASLLAESGQTLSEIVAAQPVYFGTPDVRIPFTGDDPALFERVSQQAAADGAEVIRIDGVRAEYERGWALVRASVTEPALTLRFEGRTHEDMLAVAETFLAALPEIHDAVMDQVNRS